MKSPVLALGHALLAALFAVATAFAQTYPAKPITIVVPFSAGGPTDTLARIMGERMRKTLGQPILVDNTTGAGGSIGTAKVVRAAPDGYMVEHRPLGHARRERRLLHAAVQPADRFRAGGDDRDQSAAHHLEDRRSGEESERADRLDQGESGQGPDGHRRRRRRVAHGGASTSRTRSARSSSSCSIAAAPRRLQALLGGEIDLYVTQVSNVAAQIKAGQSQSLCGDRQDAPGRRAGHADRRRSRACRASHFGLARHLAAERHAAGHRHEAQRGDRRNARRSDVRQRFAELGQEIPPREQQTPEALFAHHKAEIDKWWPMIKAAGLKAE